jgi:hypothetical protein
VPAEQGAATCTEDGAEPAAQRVPDQAAADAARDCANSSVAAAAMVAVIVGTTAIIYDAQAA